MLIDKTNINRLLREKQYSEPMRQVLNLFGDNCPDVLSLNLLLKSSGRTMEDLREESIDVILNYIELCLEDDVLTQTEMETLVHLKRFLRIKEGDFLKYNKGKEIENILFLQLTKIFADNKVDNNEAMMKIDLQRLFDLSYDQYLAFEQRAVEEALSNGANIEDLDTCYNYKKSK